MNIYFPIWTKMIQKSFFEKLTLVEELKKTG